MRWHVGRDRAEISGWRGQLYDFLGFLLLAMYRLPPDSSFTSDISARQGKPMTLCQEDIIRGLMADRLNLLAYIRAIVIHQHAAEDIHQEVLIQALQNAD